ncbi:uncharacterized protein LOC134721856 [Mytilus trossulus]|uniref:uncharacterized protein LOC134721856 n=1 Tax=Mytilus trossulus TaxID=6551 RepID=UPI003006F3E9
MVESTVVETLHQIPTSTYRYSYKGDKKTLPPIKYYQLKSIVHRYARQQPPRHFPIEPITPHRILQDEKGPALGLGTKGSNTQQYLEPKTITQTPAPQNISSVRPKSSDKTKQNGRKIRNERLTTAGSKKTSLFQTNFGHLDSNYVNSLLHKYQWTSATKQANGEACLPVTKVAPPTSVIEKKADMIRLSGQRYESSVGDWQNAVLWDRIQLRGHVLHADLKEKSIGMPEKILLKRINEGKLAEKRPRINSPKIRKLLEDNKIHKIYVRQCPGYAGFVPRQPPKIEMEREPERTHMTSVMKASYRELPGKEYRPQNFARKGPMSKTVTLTYPFNPFNKVTCEPVLVKSYQP